MSVAGIDYVEAGEGPAVLCLHGIGGGAESFLSQMPGTGFAPPSASPKSGALPPNPRSISGPKMGLAGYRVIAWNMPGYGRSEPVALSFAALSERLAGFIAALGLARVHLVGQSIGGMLALEHALRCPDQVASLTLIGTTPSFGGRDDSFREAFLKARLGPLESGQSMVQIAAEAAPRLVGPTAGPGVIAAIAAPMAMVPPATWRGILECLVRFNRRDDLGSVAQPCCLIAGGHDQNAPARTMAKMAAKLPDAEYHLIEEAGHMINQEAPERTNAIIADFLGRRNI